jgi:hypothetical protein
MNRYTCLARLARAALALLGLALLAPGPAGADTTYKVQPIVKLGDTLGETPFQALRDFIVDSLNDHGQIFFGTYTSSAENRGSEVRFLYDNGTFTPIVVPDGEAPGGKWPKNVGVWHPASMNQRGDVVFVPYDLDLARAGRFPTRFSTFLWDSQARKVVLLAPEGLPPTDGTTFWRPTGYRPAINNQNEVAFVADLRDASGKLVGNGLFFLGRDGKLVPVAVPGQKLPGGETVRYAFFPTINDAGRIAFLVQESEQDQGLSAYLWDKGTITPLVQAGADAPGGGKIASIPGAYVNNRNNNVLVWAILNNVNGGPWGLYLLADGKLSPVAVERQDQEMPGGGKVRIIGGRQSISPPNDAGQSAFFAILGNGTGAYLVDADGKLSLIVKSGMTTDLGVINGVGLARGESFGIGLNNKGQVAVALSIVGMPRMIALLTPTAP